MNSKMHSMKAGKRIINMMIIMVFVCSRSLIAQSDKKYIREGNREYEKNKYPDSEISYRKATDKNKNSADAVFNIGDALYKQKKYEDAGKEFVENVKMNEDRNKKSAAMYNLGNSLIRADKVSESIDAYKGSLKLNPENDQAKYNLAYAQDLLRKQQQQQKQQEQNKNNKDQNKDKNKKDQNNKNDQNNQDKNRENNNKQKQEQQQQQQQNQQTMSKDDAERLLNSLANEEKDVQEKVKLAQAAREKVRSVKNW